MTADLLVQVLENLRDRIEALETAQEEITAAVMEMIQSNNQTRESHAEVLAGLQRTIDALQADDPDAGAPWRQSLEDPDA